jgi:hypothetical protein
MSAPQPVPEAAGALLAALERYRLHAGRLAGRGADPDLYHEVALDLDEVRRCCQALPMLSARWVALLIAHAEWMHSLWQSGRTPAVEGERARLLAKVLDSAQALQSDCGGLAGG